MKFSSEEFLVWPSICSRTKLFPKTSEFPAPSFPYIDELSVVTAALAQPSSASIFEFEIDWKGPSPILWREREAKSWGSYARRSQNCAEDIRHHRSKVEGELGGSFFFFFILAQWILLCQIHTWVFRSIVTCEVAWVKAQSCVQSPQTADETKWRRLDCW